MLRPGSLKTGIFASPPPRISTNAFGGAISGRSAASTAALGTPPELPRFRSGKSARVARTAPCRQAGALRALKRRGRGPRRRGYRAPTGSRFRRRGLPGGPGPRGGEARTPRPRGRHPWHASGGPGRSGGDMYLVVVHRHGEGAGIGSRGLGGAHVQRRTDVERLAAAGGQSGARAGVVGEGIDGHGVGAAGQGRA